MLAPYLSWSDIEQGYAPFLARLAEEGAVANLNTNSRNRAAVRPDIPVQGALTLSSGVWAAADPDAAAAYGIDEEVSVGTAGDAYMRVMGVGPAEASIVYLGLPRAQRFNARSSTLDVRLGGLGEAITAAGGVTAAIGNSDLGHPVRDGWRIRPAAIVAMDESGRVGLGDVSQDLLVEDSRAPFGVVTDHNKFAAAYRRTLDELDGHEGPQLVVLDPGDLVRAEVFRPDVAAQVSERHHLEAVRSLDRIVRLVAEEMAQDAVLLVVPQTTTRSLAGPAPFVPLIAWSPADLGWSGVLLTSSSTQQRGLVTNMDVPVTITRLLGVERPVSFLGNQLVSQSAEPTLQQRIDYLQHFSDVAVAIEAARVPAINTFIGLTMLVLGISVFVLFRFQRWSTNFAVGLSSASRSALLACLAAPFASTAMFASGLDPVTRERALLVFGLLTAMIWVIAMAFSRFAAFRVPMALIALGNALILMMDQWLGGPWSYTGILSFSPLVAARYYGMGNEGAAILMGALPVGLALIIDEYASRRWTKMLMRVGFPVIGLIATITGAAPFLGANVAVAVWGAVTFAVAWALTNRIRIDWRVITVTVLLAVVLIAAFSFIDLAKEDGAQTHLGRAWSSAAEGGISELWLIVVRKAETNMRILTRTNWSYLLIAVVGFLAFMRWRPQGDFAETLRENPAFSAAMAGCLAGGAVAYVTEDSGIVIPALMVLYVGTAILYLMLGRLEREKRVVQTGETATSGCATGSGS